jgi:hypothetical protein
MKDVDRLIQESDEALRRLERIERGRRQPGTIIERATKHAKRHSNRLMSVALAGGMLGLSLLRYREKQVHREEVEQLQRLYEGAKRRGLALADTVDEVLKQGGTGENRRWWGSPEASRGYADSLHGAVRKYRLDVGLSPSDAKLSSVSVNERVPEPNDRSPSPLERRSTAASKDPRVENERPFI